jgi:hypothetical protein
MWDPVCVVCVFITVGPVCVCLLPVCVLLLQDLFDLVQSCLHGVCPNHQVLDFFFKKDKLNWRQAPGASTASRGHKWADVSHSPTQRCLHRRGAQHGARQIASSSTA